jgi:hypothetical protein
MSSLGANYDGAIEKRKVITFMLNYGIDSKAKTEDNK